MPLTKIPRQLQEEIIFPRELKGFRYEEVTSWNDIGKQKICAFEKSGIVKKSQKTSYQHWTFLLEPPYFSL